MAEVVWVQACADADMSGGTCTAAVWVPQAESWPTLSVDDAQLLGAAIAGLWAFAWVIRRMKKLLDQLG